MEKLSLIVLLLCLVASLGTFFQRNQQIFLRFFPFYFIVTLAVQVSGDYFQKHGIHNTLLYNCFSALEFAFYFLVLRAIIHTPKVKRVLLLVAILYPFISFINIFFFQGETVFHTLTYSVGCGLIAVFCILYFVELFQLERAIDLMKEPSFWICTGTLFSYVCNFPFWGMVNFMKLSTGNYQKALTMMMVINILSYVIFLIAFLCRIRIRKSIS